MNNKGILPEGKKIKIKNGSTSLCFEFDKKEGISLSNLSFEQINYISNPKSILPIIVDGGEFSFVDSSATTTIYAGKMIEKASMVVRKEDRVQRPLNYCIIDEVDSVLIDEARTPLIISGGFYALGTFVFAKKDFK